ncbi:MAG: hypothetical protein ACOYOP_12935 [Microthrixaceae bacterium]
MFRPRTSAPTDRGVGRGPAEVTTLPDDYLVRRFADFWAVVGPTGVFLVHRCDGDRTTGGLATAAAALDLRNRLSEHVSPTPFVTAVLVVDDEGTPEPADGCTVVAVGELRTLIEDGPTVLDDWHLHGLRLHLPGVVQALELEPRAPIGG